MSTSGATSRISRASLRVYILLSSQQSCFRDENGLAKELSEAEAVSCILFINGSLSEDTSLSVAGKTSRARIEA